MSRHATFENFGMAFLTLFQVSTGDNWNGIMKVHVGGQGRESQAEFCLPSGPSHMGGCVGHRDAGGPAHGPGAQVRWT